MWKENTLRMVKAELIHYVPGVHFSDVPDNQWYGKNAAMLNKDSQSLLIEVVTKQTRTTWTCIDL